MRFQWTICAALFALCAACSGGGGGGGSTPGAGGGGGDGGGGGGATLSAELDITNVVFSPATVTAGESVLVGDTVRNDGNADAGSFRVGVYLSSDDVWDAHDVLLGSRVLAALASGAESTGGGTLQVPSETAEGSWRVLAVADDQGQVDEGDESNARAADEPLTVTGIQLAELVASECTLVEQLIEAGQPIHVGDTVRNEGGAHAGAFRVGLYLSLDTAVDPLDVLLGFRSVTALDAGAEDADVGVLTVPAGTAAGVYRVIAWADDQDQEPETNELDNVRVAQTALTVVPPALANLISSSVTFTPHALDVGQDLLVSEAVLNTGQASATTFQVGVYLSSDSVIDAGDLLLGLRSVPGLAPGIESGVQDTAFTLPSSLAAGTWYVGVLADATELTPETDENDNALTALGTLEVSVPPLPDLVPTVLTFSPNVVDADLGPSVLFDEGVENIGNGTAAQFRLGLYMSSTSAVTSGDLLVHERQVVSLDVGATSSAGASFEVPPGTPPGTYYLGLLVDDESAVSELSEGNNLLVALGTLDVVGGGGDPAPNLIVELVSTSTGVVTAGDSFSVLTKVRNAGDLSAGAFHTGIYLSTDSTITSTDTLIGERYQLNGLGVGFLTVVSGPVTVPLGVPPGVYHLGAIADHLLAVPESNELDNSQVAVGLVTVQ